MRNSANIDGRNESHIGAQCALLLRDLRRRRGLTLEDFEKLSDGAVKAVVLGSYERGTRAISLARLEQLAGIYQVPIQYFLSGDKVTEKNEVHSKERLAFDLRRVSIEGESDPILISLRKFLSRVVRDRSDWNGEVLTVRSEDSRILEMMTELDSGELMMRMRQAGFLFGVKGG